MSATPTLGELLLGIEGLALLRLAFGDDAEARRARVREIRDLLRRLDEDPELAAPLGAPEYDLTEDMRSGRRPTISRSACSRSSTRCCVGCSIRCLRQSSSMPRAGPGATASIWLRAGIG
jgi:hypothetical protein